MPRGDLSALDSKVTPGPIHCVNSWLKVSPKKHRRKGNLFAHFSGPGNRQTTISCQLPCRIPSIPPRRAQLIVLNRGTMGLLANAETVVRSQALA